MVLHSGRVETNASMLTSSDSTMMHQQQAIQAVGKPWSSSHATTGGQDSLAM